MKPDGSDAEWPKERICAKKMRYRSQEWMNPICNEANTNSEQCLKF